MEALGFVYLGGFIVAWIVLYHRVGFPDVKPDWREFVLAHPTGFGGWAVATIAKTWFWPATLILWLASFQVEGCRRNRRSRDSSNLARLSGCAVLNRNGQGGHLW
jgi:hypothetical protein